MPELPEVETVVADCAGSCLDAASSACIWARPILWTILSRSAKCSPGRRIVAWSAWENLFAFPSIPAARREIPRRP